MAIGPITEAARAGAIELVMTAHEELKGRLLDCEAMEEDGFHSWRREIAEQAFRAVERHLLPDRGGLSAAREPGVGAQDASVITAREEECAVIAGLICELRRQGPSGWRFEVLFDALVEGVERHIEREEAGLFRHLNDWRGAEVEGRGRAA
ncbi:MAG: hypothetical protein C5B48_09465 [Candidatus Rokuibacteriota bacterium]|nr:MAG: hypothetical protein C5B48_09465 [Candidatus Rokubacteria bacterium]